MRTKHSATNPHVGTLYFDGILSEKVGEVIPLIFNSSPSRGEEGGYWIPDWIGNEEVPGLRISPE